LPVQPLDRLAVLIEERRTRVVRRDRLPVRLRPARVGDRHVLDRLEVAAADVDRNRQPLDAVPRLDAVAVAPVTLRVLHIVEQDELVAPGDEVEVTLPRNVVRLNDRDGLRGHRYCWPAPADGSNAR